MLDSVASSGSGFTALPAISVSGDGSVVARHSRPAIVELTWLSRNGQLVEPLGVPAGPISHLELSPDGSRLAYQVGGRYAGELWTFDLSRHTATRASIRGPGVLAPLWFPNGDRLVVSSIRGVSGNSNLYEMAPEGEPLTPFVEASAGMIAIGWTSDARLFFTHAVAPPPAVIQLLGPDRRPNLYFDPHSNIATARVSPDGQAIAYTSNQSGRPEVYLVGYPSPGPVTARFDARRIAATVATGFTRAVLSGARWKAHGAVGPARGQRVESRCSRPTDDGPNAVDGDSAIPVRCRSRRQPFRRRRRAARGPGFVDGRSKLDVAVSSVTIMIVRLWICPSLADTRATRGRIRSSRLMSFVEEEGCDDMGTVL